MIHTKYFIINRITKLGLCSLSNNYSLLYTKFFIPISSTQLINPLLIYKVLQKSLSIIPKLFSNSAFYIINFNNQFSPIIKRYSNILGCSYSNISNNPHVFSNNLKSFTSTISCNPTIILISDNVLPTFIKLSLHITKNVFLISNYNVNNFSLYFIPLSKNYKHCLSFILNQLHTTIINSKILYKHPKLLPKPYNVLLLPTPSYYFLIMLSGTTNLFTLKHYFKKLTASACTSIMSKNYTKLYNILSLLINFYKELFKIKSIKFIKIKQKYMLIQNVTTTGYVCLSLIYGTILPHLYTLSLATYNSIVTIYHSNKFLLPTSINSNLYYLHGLLLNNTIIKKVYLFSYLSVV